VRHPPHTLERDKRLMTTTSTPVTSTYGTASLATLTRAATKAGVSIRTYQHAATLNAARADLIIITPPPPPPATETWWDHMGVSITAPHRADVASALRYGRWIRAGWEEPWPITGLADLVKATHAAGGKVLACLQPSGQRYAGWDLARFARFADWVASVAALGVDGIEIGNELNNPMFNAARDVKETVAAMLAAVVADRLRTSGFAGRVITNGFAPMGAEPDYYPQDAVWRMLDRATELGLPLQGRISGVGYHPYEMTTHPTVPPGGHLGWNACWWLGLAWNSMQARGLSVPLCLTEYGKWGSEADQATWAADYLRAFDTHRKAGVELDLLCWHTLVEGSSTVSAAEVTMGIVKADGTEKQAGKVLRDWGTRAW